MCRERIYAPFLNTASILDIFREHPIRLMPEGKREDYAQQSGATGLLCSSQEEAISRMRDSIFSLDGEIR